MFYIACRTQGSGWSRLSILGLMAVGFFYTDFRGGTARQGAITCRSIRFWVSTFQNIQKPEFPPLQCDVKKPWWSDASWKAQGKVKLNPCGHFAILQILQMFRDLLTSLRLPFSSVRAERQAPCTRIRQKQHYFANAAVAVRGGNCCFDHNSFCFRG